MTMDYFLENAWIIPAVPAASFFLILFFGKRLPNKGSEIGIAAVGASFVMAVLACLAWFNRVDASEHGTEAVTQTWTWW
jgi:NADH-quinone oxidoreductase subunit L